MSDDLPVIEVRNVVKEYRLGALDGLRTLGRRLLGRAVPERQRFRALDDVSFSIQRGEVVGIIGHNGAGKSTLLKLLCNITTPTNGSVTVRGRIAPLIEVGAGLVGDMTGRENIYLNASILGLKREQIDGKVDEIIDFAELRPFIDTPVKRYSSGMQVKLGFAIATAVPLEVLIVDEVLAVGDLNFQRKCLERIEALIRDDSRTVLIVGHNIRQLERVCKRMILLGSGRILMDDRAKIVSNTYFEQSELLRLKGAMTGLASTRGGGIELSQLIVNGNQSAEEVIKISLHDSVKFELILQCDRDFRDVDVAIGFHTLDFFHIATFNTAPQGLVVELLVGFNIIVCTVPDVPLMPGIYGIRIGISDEFGRTVWYGENIRSIQISSVEASRSRMSLQALVDVPANWKISQNRGIISEYST